MKKNSLQFYFYCCLVVCNQFLGSHAFATGNYQEPSEFIQEVFSGDVPKVSKIWIKKDLKLKIREIMEHDLGVLRLKYWKKDNRTVWVLEEIGKVRLITAGIVINDSKIESIKVLAFRESRGWEVRYPFFTDQFSDAALKENKQLDRHIDGISGATLSVKAMTKMARLALFLHQEIERKAN
ncbi:MAG: FMN-binding protein [Gammaproteobacteria bacterium]